MEKDIEKLIDVEYLSRVEEDETVRLFEKEYKEELKVIRDNIPYVLIDKFDDVIGYHSKYFALLKKQIFKKGFFLGLKAKMPE